MVNRENLNKLADALESGKYVQGRLSLRNHDNGHCCLGVACDISGLGEWQIGEDSHLFDYVITDNGEPHASRYVLTNPLRKWLGITENGDFTTVDGRELRLVDLNDNFVPFAEIAKILRDESVKWDVPN